MIDYEAVDRTLKVARELNKRHKSSVFPLRNHEGKTWAQVKEKKK